jgi:crotonobetainyl-CoA:carnitine CoA-transferase CaiB-like acyl-CoA transferase
MRGVRYRRIELSTPPTAGFDTRCGCQPYLRRWLSIDIVSMLNDDSGFDADYGLEGEYFDDVRCLMPGSPRVVDQRGGSMTTGPLTGLRVVEMTGDHARLAGKMLIEAGASVVRVGPAFAGPAMHHPAVAARGGLLDWWFDGGKEVVFDDLGSEEGRDAYRRLAEVADLVIESSPPGRLADLGLDHDALVEVNPQLVQVSLTPFGRTGPRAHWQTSDLVAGALGGVLSVSGTPDHPVNPWGRQNVNFGSFMAAICGLAGVWDARESGAGQHVDLSLHETVVSSLEHVFFQWWFSDLLPLPKRALRQGSLHWLGAYVVANARTGACNISTAPNPALLFDWMAEEGDAEGAALAALPPEEVLGQMPRVMAAVKRFALTKDSGELFAEAQRRHIAFGEVQTVAQVAANPQYEHRGSFRPVEGFADVRMPGPFARFGSGRVAEEQPPRSQPPPSQPASIDDVLARWGSGRDTTPAEGRRHRTPTADGKPLEGLRVVDFTWVLAGPFANRILGDLGADVLKFQTAERATLVNSPGFPFFYVWNRSKRLLSLDMKRPEALAIIRKVVEQSDVLMENFSAGVLTRWGLDYETVRQWNPEIVYVTKSGPGHDGPWSNVITYAPTIHALCGLTYLSNPPGRSDVGPGFSLNDHAAGFASVVAVLAALEERRRTGEGQHIDIAQMETGTYLIGPAVLDHFANGREAHPRGNADPFDQYCPNEVYRCGDQEELAITCRDDDDWRRLCETVAADIRFLAEDDTLRTVAGRIARASEIDECLRSWCATRSAEAGAEQLQANGVPAGRVQDAGDLMDDPQLVARDFWRSVEHALYGTRPYDRFPARWSGTDLEPYLPSGAYIGEHNFDAYVELAGLEFDAIAEGMGDGLFA